MRMHENGKMLYWLVGAMFAIILTLAGFSLTSLRSQLDTIDMHQLRQAENLAALRAEYVLVEQRLSRMEDKLDAMQKR